jgi:diguanylate cyclase (GGDEF)-like protein
VKRVGFAVAAAAAALGAASSVVDADAGAAVLYEVGVWASIGLTWWAVRRLDGSDRAAWWLVAVALTLWGIGDLAWDALDLTGSGADASFADVFYLAGYVVVAAGVLVMIRRRPTGRREALLDGTAFASAIAVVIWLALVRPDSGDSADRLVMIVLAAYPLMDALLVAALLWLVLTPGGDGWGQRLLVTGIVAMAVVDAAYALLSRAEMDSVRYANAAYPACYAIVALAVCHASSTLDTRTRPRAEIPHLHPGRALLLGSALVLAPAAAAMSATSEASMDRIVLLVVTCAISIMVLTRFVNEAHARERIHDDIVFLAAHDPLTGLLNRRSFLTEADAVVSEQPCALFYIDLDGFKWLNDSIGHDAGDDALVDTARRLVASVRDGDLVARLGGDEFAICSPGLADPVTAEALADRLRTSLHRIHPNMTASIGAAIAPQGMAATALLKIADAAMYRAKRAGGNKALVDLTAAAV